MFDDERELTRGFECNICLDLAHDPVITFCGHLYCWPCIYKWIHLQSIPSENPSQRHPQCPVCKADISQRSMVPLYGRGQVTKTSEDDVTSNGMVIPERPPSLRRGGDVIATTDHHSHPSQQPQIPDPLIGETSHAPTLYPYPNSYHLAGSNTLRMRRHQLQADDKSLRRLHFFLICCLLICLIFL